MQHADENPGHEITFLETLLSITERFKDQMNGEDRKVWENIAAETANLRDGEDV